MVIQGTHGKKRRSKTSWIARVPCQWERGKRERIHVSSQCWHSAAPYTNSLSLQSIIKDPNFGKHWKTTASWFYFHHKWTLAQTCQMSWHYLQWTQVWQKPQPTTIAKCLQILNGWNLLSYKTQFSSQNLRRIGESITPTPRPETHTPSPPRRSLGGELSFHFVPRLQGRWTRLWDWGDLGRPTYL